MTKKTFSNSNISAAGREANTRSRARALLKLLPGQDRAIPPYDLTASGRSLFDRSGNAKLLKVSNIDHGPETRKRMMVPSPPCPGIYR
jgi:hypothetical protein